MKRLAATLLSAAVLAAGCTTGAPRYAKPDSTETKTGEALTACRAEGREAMTEGAKEAVRQGREQAEIVDQCMKAKGYARAGAS